MRKRLVTLGLKIASVYTVREPSSNWSMIILKLFRELLQQMFAILTFPAFIFDFSVSGVSHSPLKKPLLTWPRPGHSEHSRSQALITGSDNEWNQSDLPSVWSVHVLFPLYLTAKT